MADSEKPNSRDCDSGDHRRMRTLNVEVPEGVYWLVRQCATESRLSMKAFMAKFCREAHPYTSFDNDTEGCAIERREPAGPPMVR